MAQYASQMNNNKLISAASSYNIERSLNTPLVGKVALFHATQALLAQARAPQGGDQGFRSGDTRKMAETSRGATVRNVPGTRSEARRSERSVTFVTLATSHAKGCVRPGHNWCSTMHPGAI